MRILVQPDRVLDIGPKVVVILATMSEMVQMVALYFQFVEESHASAMETVYTVAFLCQPRLCVFYLTV